MVFAVALGQLAAEASAQGSGQEQADGDGLIEEIVVTARRREENLQAVPIAVSALSSAELSEQGLVDITEVAQRVPSVTLEPTRATNTTLTAFIRGVGQQDPLAGFEQGVALYVDDVYIARPQGSLLDIYDVDRIEVLRGPQGTLYGRNAVGGAIKYVTRRLGQETQLRVQGTLGTENRTDVVATVAFPLSDSFAIGGTIASLNRDGFGSNLFTGEENYNKEVLAWRMSAEYGSEDLFIRLAVDNTQDDSNPTFGYRPYPAPVSDFAVLPNLRDTRAGATREETTAGIGGRNQIEAEGFHLSIEWAIDEQWTLRSITGSREDYTESVIDFDSLPSHDFDAPVIYDNEQLSQEIQLHYTTDNLNLVAGFYYLDASAANDFDVVLGDVAGGLTGYTGGTVDTEAVSLFADVTWDLSDRLSLSLGGRYTDDERTADIFRQNYLGIGSPFFGNAAATAFGAPQSDYESTQSFTNFSPRINVAWALDDNTQVYAGYSQGWKAGSFDPRGAAHPDSPNQDIESGFDPETLTSIELGFKSIYSGGRALTNVALFLSDYEDMQIPGSVGIDTDGNMINDSFIGTVTNAGKAQINGVEVEGLFWLSDSLNLTLALSLLDASIEEWIFNGVDVSDDREVQNTPEEMLNLGLSWTGEALSGKITVGGNLSYKSDIVQFETPLPAIDQEAHNILNVSAVWTSRDEHWQVGIHGKNLTDEAVRTAGYCFGATAGCPSALGLEDNTTVFYGPPQTLAVSLEYRL